MRASPSQPRLVRLAAKAMASPRGHETLEVRRKLECKGWMTRALLVGALSVLLTGAPAWSASKRRRPARKSAVEKAPPPEPAPPAAATEPPTEPTAPPEPTSAIRLATPGLSVLQLPAEAAQFYTEHLAQRLNATGVRVITQREIAAILGMERQRQLMGCASESTNCVAELANALGVDGVLLGDIGKFGKSFQVNVKVLAAVDGRLLASRAGRVGDEEQVLDFLNVAAREMARELAQRMNRPLPALPEEERPAAQLVGSAGPTRAEPPLRGVAWVPAAVGGVFLVGAGFFGWQTLDQHQRLVAPTGPALTDAEAQQTAQGLRTSQALTWVGIGGAAVSAAVAVAFYTMGGGESATPVVSISPQPGGAHLALGGSF